MENNNSTVASEMSDISSKSSIKGIIILTVIFIVLIVAVSFLVYKKVLHKSPVLTQNTNNLKTTSKPTPVISPVTASNADQTLSNTNAAIEQSINNANTNLSSLSSINTSQDSTTGL